jgi:hypothetical protein
VLTHLPPIFLLGNYSILVVQLLSQARPAFRDLAVLSSTRERECCLLVLNLVSSNLCYLPVPLPLENSDVHTPLPSPLHAQERIRAASRHLLHSSVDDRWILFTERYGPHGRWPVFRQEELLDLTKVCTTPGLLTVHFAPVRLNP